MKLLYISALSSERLIAEIYKQSGQNPGFAVQKFSRLLVKGLRSNGADISAISTPPYTGKKFFVNYTAEEEDNVKYKYIPFLNFPIIKHLCLFLYTFIYVLFWGISNRKKKCIICDVLAVSICMGALLASKINRVKSVAVVTDIYGLIIGEKKKAFLSKLAAKLNSLYSGSFNQYILLTEQMNEITNPRNRPHIVMEALCDSSIQKEPVKQIEKSFPRTVIYAGGIFEKYGLKTLAEGFVKASVKDAILVYYGSGPYVEEFKSLCAEHPNLEYRGVAPNEEVVAEELKASLLVNPRFTTEEFTKYSFPSKNMEYMASGTPLLTTKLPGMPVEYYPYIFLFEEETVEGYARAIKSALSHTDTELATFGLKAKEFVLRNKNNIEQGRRILDLIESK